MSKSATGEEIGRTRAEDEFEATGNGTVFRPTTDPRGSTAGNFNAAVWGTFVGTAVLERSFDNGTTWIAARDRADAAISLTAPGSYQLRENERGTAYRWRCSAYTSGTINARLSQ